MKKLITTILAILTLTLTSQAATSTNTNTSRPGSASGLATLNLMAIPEPSTASVLLGGSMGLIAVKLWRRNKCKHV